MPFHMTEEVLLIGYCKLPKESKKHMQLCLQPSFLSDEAKEDETLAKAISMSGFETATDRLALTLSTESSIGLIETKKWADHFQEKISKDDINSEEGIAAATLALEDMDNKIVIESNPGQSMEEIEAKMNEEKLKEQALLDAKNEQALADEALKLMCEPTKLNLANPLGKKSHKSYSLISLRQNLFDP